MSARGAVHCKTSTPKISGGKLSSRASSMRVVHCKEAVSLRDAELGGHLPVEAALVGLAESRVPLGDGIPVGEVLPVPG
eukprot:9147831-Pyramimonas_sp.AAC.1